MFFFYTSVVVARASFTFLVFHRMMFLLVFESSRFATVNDRTLMMMKQSSNASKFNSHVESDININDNNSDNDNDAVKSKDKKNHKIRTKVHFIKRYVKKKNNKKFREQVFFDQLRMCYIYLFHTQLLILNKYCHCFNIQKNFHRNTSIVHKSIDIDRSKTSLVSLSRYRRSLSEIEMN